MSAEEFEELENLDGVEEATEDLSEQSSNVQTSDQSSAAEASAESNSSRFGFLSSLTVYDAMLLTSLLAVSLASVLMLLELFSFGFPFFQWRTGEALVEPVRPPV